VTASVPGISSVSGALMHAEQPPEARGTGEFPEEGPLSKTVVSKDGRAQMRQHDSEEVIRPLAKRIVQPVLQQQQQPQQPQLKAQQQQMHRPAPTCTHVGLKARQQVFLKSCSPVQGVSFRDINASAAKFSLFDGSLGDEKQHQHVGPQRMASSPVEILHGRKNSPTLQYREMGVKRQQSGPSRGIDDDLLKLWDQSVKDATGGMQDRESRPRNPTEVSETPCSLNTTTTLGVAGSTLQTNVASNEVGTPECGSTRQKEVNENDAMSVSTRSCTDDGEVSTAKRCSAPSVIDRQEEQCAGALFFDLAADDLDDDEADFFPEHGGVYRMGRKSSTRKSMSVFLRGGRSG